MTATAEFDAASAEQLTPLADYLGSVRRQVRALPALDLDLTQARGKWLAESVLAQHPFPAFDQAGMDGYAARADDLVPTAPGRPVRLNVIGDLSASSWRPARLTPQSCFAVAAGASLPIG